MLARSVFKKLLGWEDVTVKAVNLDSEGLVLDVRIAAPHARCSKCGRVHSVYDRLEPRTWRHLDLGGLKWKVRYALRRVKCAAFGVVVEAVPWAEVGAWHTKDFEDQIGYLAQRVTKSDIVEQMRIGWRTVGEIVKRVLARHDERDLLANLTHIGVDELSLNGHDYITIVYDHRRGGVVWSSPGKTKETLKGFFELLGPERRKLIEVVTMDMAKAYLEAVRESVPSAVIVFDRFHVQRLAHDALDELRRSEVRAAGGPTKVPGLKRLRWALHKNPWNLNLEEQERLSTLPTVNRRLYNGYLLKEALAGILDGRQWRVAERRLGEWLSWARRSRLKPFQRLARTIAAHLDGILAYIRTGLSNGMAEGINNKIRVVTKRSYGFHSAENLIAMIFLCCSGLTLLPIHKTIDSTES